MSAYLVAVEGLASIKSFEDVPQAVVRAARMAINRTSERAKAHAAREIRKQVNFAARYLTGEEGRLRVSKKASGSNLEAVVTGRHRPTSLARFSSARNPAASRKAGGVTVEVKPGVAKFMKKAFLIRLRAGNALTDTNHNLGLAVRLKPGETITSKRKMVQIGHNLYLLYGPSVDQVFRTVSGDIAGDTFDFLENEFQRLMGVELG